MDKDPSRGGTPTMREAVDRCFRRMAEAQSIVIDCETSGLDWRYNHVIGYVFAVGPAPEDSFYFPVRHAGGGNLTGTRVPKSATSWDGSLHPLERRFAKTIARRSDCTFIGHNLAFDLKFLARAGIHLAGHRLECTQVNASLIDENQSSFSLEACCKAMGTQSKETVLYEYLSSLLGCKPDKSSMGQLWETSGDDPVVVQYAKGDGTSTWQLREAQVQLIEELALDRVWDVERRVTRTLHRMSWRGIKIDEEQLARSEIEVIDMLDEAREKLPEGLNVKSNVEIRRLVESLGITDWPTTDHVFWVCPSCKYRKKTPRTHERETEAKACPKCGTFTKPHYNPSFKEPWLLKQGPVGEAIVDVRRLLNILNSFIEPMKERHLWDGRVHTNFNQAKSDDYGAVSGRLSSSDPNLQGGPRRREKLARLYRSIFIPDTGCVLGVHDYFQQDLLVFAHYIARLSETNLKFRKMLEKAQGSDKSELVKGYRSIPPIDAHSVVANILKVERDPTAKRMNLGCLNAMGIAKMAASLGTTETVAKGYMNAYHKRFPEARAFIDAASSVAENRGHVFTLLGRRRRYTHKNSHVACSGIIQGGSADLMKLKMVEVDEWFMSQGDECHILLQIHDDLVWQTPEHGAEEQDRRALEILTSFGDDDMIQLLCPMYVDYGIGKNWAEATFPKEKNRYPPYEHVRDNWTVPTIKAMKWEVMNREKK